jgi:hypothetical protein
VRGIANSNLTVGNYDRHHAAGERRSAFLWRNDKPFQPGLKAVDEHARRP